LTGQGRDKTGLVYPSLAYKVVKNNRQTYTGCIKQNETGLLVNISGPDEVTETKPICPEN
jgi:hypothetical protein